MRAFLHTVACLTLAIAPISAANEKSSGFGQRPPPWIQYDVPNEFSDPTGLARPAFRYWVPDADVSNESLYEDLSQIKQAGWNGVEIICLENYGIELAVVDPAIYGYGGQNWREKFKVMLQAAQDLNLTIDFALGPTQGASIPILDPDSPGMSTELAYGQINLTAGEVYNGSIPPPSRVNPGYANAPDFYPPEVNYTNKFVAAVLARRSSSLSEDPRVIQLDYNSTHDISSQVQGGSISFTTPTDGDYILFGFWQRRTGYLAAQGAFGNKTNPNNPASWFAYVVDHFSQEGTDLWTGFTEQYVMNGENGDLLRQLGLYAWEDSAEFRATLFWTDNFVSNFQYSRGYSPIKTLPIQFGTTNLPPSTLANSYYYFTFGNENETDINWKLRNDYRQALQEMYETYHLDGLSSWSSTWNLQGSLQPYATAPNLAPPWDMVSAAAHIDAPETESNYFDGVIDAFRAMGGGAMMGQKQIFSSELGAHRYFAYAATWPLILNDCKINYAGGVNRIVTHGYPYSGLRPSVEWPGLTTFEWTYSEMWGPRQPSWEFTKEFGDWIGRTQLILQTGKPRVDIGIYRHKYISVDIKHFGMGENIFGDVSLANNGYSYVSVSPSLLTAENAVLDDGLLATSGPGFSAFIIDNSTNITTGAVNRLLEYASANFPILLVGGVPYESPYFCQSCDEEVAAGMKTLLNYRSVKNLSTEAEVVPTLLKMNILPAALNLSPCPIIYTQRIDESNNVSYFWAYNSDIYRGHATEVSIKSGGLTPYILDAWTGTVVPIVNYTVNGDRHLIWLNLKSNATTIIAFAPEGFFNTVEVPSVHVVSTGIEDLSYYPSTKSLIARSTAANNNYTVQLSDGRTTTVSVPEALPTSTTLGPWHLLVEDWLPNPDPFQNYTSVIKYHNYTLQQLIPWPNITGLEHVSGVGTYQTQFQWPPSNSSNVASGAYLDLGLIFNTARVWVNDQWTGPLDVQNPIADISSYLVNGTNNVKVVVSTTLRNRLIQVNVTQSWEQANYSAVYGVQPYGLTSPVLLKPFYQAEIPV